MDCAHCRWTVHILYGLCTLWMASPARTLSHSRWKLHTLDGTLHGLCTLYMDCASPARTLQEPKDDGKRATQVFSDADRKVLATTLSMPDRCSKDSKNSSQRSSGEFVRPGAGEHASNQPSSRQNGSGGNASSRSFGLFRDSLRSDAYDDDASAELSAERDADNSHALNRGACTACAHRAAAILWPACTAVFRVPLQL